MLFRLVASIKKKKVLVGVLTWFDGVFYYLGRKFGGVATTSPLD
ncbi:hypothetical protein HMPREF0297_0442 [Corynebacterium jeikeium ATCC 43734]|nr:hypothetical protein HMPREF0297_0442 [Corynebacterium jeikeium ATCC 43734]